MAGSGYFWLRTPYTTPAVVGSIERCRKLLLGWLQTWHAKSAPAPMLPPTQVLPTAFLGKMDESSEVAAAWGGVWEEGAPSEGAAVRGGCVTALLLWPRSRAASR